MEVNNIAHKSLQRDADRNLHLITKDFSLLTRETLYKTAFYMRAATFFSKKRAKCMRHALRFQGKYETTT